MATWCCQVDKEYHNGKREKWHLKLLNLSQSFMGGKIKIAEINDIETQKIRKFQRGVVEKEK